MTIRLVHDAAPPADAFAHARLVSTLRVDVAGRRFATFAVALGGEPASRDVSRTVARLRAAAPAIQPPSDYALTIVTGADYVRPREQRPASIERQCLAVAAALVALVLFRAGLGL